MANVDYLDSIVLFTREGYACSQGGKKQKIMHSMLAGAENKAEKDAGLDAVLSDKYYKGAPDKEHNQEYAIEGPYFAKNLDIATTYPNCPKYCASEQVKANQASTGKNKNNAIQNIVGESNLEKKTAAILGREMLNSNVEFVWENPPVCDKDGVIRHFEHKELLRHVESYKVMVLDGSDPYRPDMLLFVPMRFNLGSFTGTTKADLAYAIENGIVTIEFVDLGTSDHPDLFFDIDEWAKERARRIKAHLAALNIKL